MSSEKGHWGMRGLGLVQFWMAAKARQARTRSTLVANAMRVK
jgi:hypothetical protein